jgi:biotin carboxylase
MVCIRSNAQTLPDSKYLSSFISLHPKDLFTKKGAAQIANYLESFNASGIIAINEEVSCWLSDCEDIRRSGICIWSSPSGAIERLLSKENQIEVARAVGFPVLETYKLDQSSDCLNRIQKRHFPLIVRPDTPRSVSPAFKVQVLEKREDLSRWVNQIARIDKPLIAQPFVNWPNLVVHGARTRNGRCIGFQSFLVERKYRSVTLTIRAIAVNPEIISKCEAFILHYGITGSFHFEFLYNPTTQEIYFLELNGRMGGTTAKVYALGYDEPLLNLAAYGICAEPETRPVNNRVVSSKNALVKYCMDAMRNRLNLLDYPREGTALRVLKSLYGLVVFRDEVLQMRDWKGSRAFYSGLLRRG